MLSWLANLRITRKVLIESKLQPGSANEIQSDRKHCFGQVDDRIEMVKVKDVLTVKDVDCFSVSGVVSVTTSS